MAFKKGNQAAKGKGRPRGSTSAKKGSFKEECKRLLDEAGFDRLEKIIKTGHDRDVIAALKFLASYGYGQPVQHVEPIEIGGLDRLEVTLIEKSKTDKYESKDSAPMVG